MIGKLWCIMLLACALTGCTTMTSAWTEGYQKTIYGHALQPGTPCKKGEVWKNMTCLPGPGGPS